MAGLGRDGPARDNAEAWRTAFGDASCRADLRSGYFQIGFDQALRPVSSITMTRSHGLAANGSSEMLVRVIAVPLLWFIR